MNYSELTAPVEKNSVIGEAVYYYDGERIGAIPIRAAETEKTTSLRKQRMGSTPRGSGLSTEMSGLRSPDYDRTEITRKKCERNR